VNIFLNELELHWDKEVDNVSEGKASPSYPSFMVKFRILMFKCHQYSSA